MRRINAGKQMIQMRGDHQHLFPTSVVIRRRQCFRADVSPAGEGAGAGDSAVTCCHTSPINSQPAEIAAGGEAGAGG